MHPREIPLLKEPELKNLKLLPSGKPVADPLPVELTAGEEII